jgi:redox-sensitive bicupin YhaK (pirin superfamily)
MHHKISSETIFHKDYGWHTGYFHFNFGDYEDPANTNFGVLTALNDFTVMPQNGFHTHPHSEVEIISYCVQGCLDHEDNMGNVSQLFRRGSQYTSTGSGITHSEMNNSLSEVLRFIQVWIKPVKTRLKPYYEYLNLTPVPDGENLRLIASGGKFPGTAKIAQDANVYAIHLEKGESMVYESEHGRQSYLYCLEGFAEVNDLNLTALDAMKLWGRETLRLTAPVHAHLLAVEMARDEG